MYYTKIIFLFLTIFINLNLCSKNNKNIRMTNLDEIIIIHNNFYNFIEKEEIDNLQIKLPNDFEDNDIFEINLKIISGDAHMIIKNKTLNNKNLDFILSSKKNQEIFKIKLYKDIKNLKLKINIKANLKSYYLLTYRLIKNEIEGKFLKENANEIKNINYDFQNIVENKSFNNSIMIFKSSSISGDGVIIIIIIIVIVIVLIISLIIYLKIRGEKEKLLNQIKHLSLRKSGAGDKEEPLVTDDAINSLQ